MRVPNERDNKGTNKVVVNLPDGFFSLSYKKVPGWTIVPTKTKLDKPVDLGEFSADTQFTKVTMTARPAGVIRPGQFEEFPRPSASRAARRATSSPSRPSRPTRAARRSAGPARRARTRPPRASP